MSYNGTRRTKTHHPTSNSDDDDKDDDWGSNWLATADEMTDDEGGGALGTDVESHKVIGDALRVAGGADLDIVALGELVAGDVVNGQVNLHVLLGGLLHDILHGLRSLSIEERLA